MRPALLLACLLAASPARADEAFCRDLQTPEARHRLAGELRRSYGVDEAQQRGRRTPYLALALAAIDRGDLLSAQRHLFWLAERRADHYPVTERINAAIAVTLRRALRECQEDWARAGE